MPNIPPQVERYQQPRVALTLKETCGALGVSWDTWRRHIEPDIKVVRVGGKELIAVAELERWLDEHGERLDRG